LGEGSIGERRASTKEEHDIGGSRGGKKGVEKSGVSGLHLPRSTGGYRVNNKNVIIRGGDGDKRRSWSIS